MRRCRSLLALSSFGLIFVACGDGDGGENGGLSFAGMCDQGSTLMCKKASECGSTTPQAECIAESKAMFCAGGEEQFCGVGLTVQASKVAACLDTLETLTCLQLSERPTACTAEVLCGSSSGSPPTAAQGEACQARESSFECNPKASICYAAGTVSSCPSGGLCLGDSNGMNCAARCTATRPRRCVAAAAPVPTPGRTSPTRTCRPRGRRRRWTGCVS